MKFLAAVAFVLVAAFAPAQDIPPPPAPSPEAPKPGDPLRTLEAPKPVEAPKVEMKVTPPPPRPEAPRALSSREAADALSEEELRQVTDLLRNNYLQPGALDELALARASVQGLLDRLGAGARIFTKPSQGAEPASPLRSEMLEGKIGYLRLGSLGEIAALDTALDQFVEKAPKALVLDLRATPQNADFELAAEVCRRFVPKGRILFSIKRPKANDEEIVTSRVEPRWRGLLVVLVDSDTSGAAEVIAGVLRTHLQAYVIGQQTKGEAAQFEDLPIGGGKVLRLAIGEVALPDNTPVFPGGLRPDLPVPVTQEKTDEVLLAALPEGVKPLVTDAVRQRFNEAALIAGTNPEFDAAQERQRVKEKGGAVKAPVRDEVLVRALDYVTSVGIYQAGKVKRR
jgi:hypothetical protein